VGKKPGASREEFGSSPGVGEDPGRTPGETRTPKRRVFHSRKETASDFHVELNAREAKWLARIKDHYDFPAATIIRLLIREEYYRLYSKELVLPTDEP
jgi:hypothetical protein